MRMLAALLMNILILINESKYFSQTIWRLLKAKKKKKEKSYSKEKNGRKKITSNDNDEKHKKEEGQRAL